MDDTASVTVDQSTDTGTAAGTQQTTQPSNPETNPKPAPSPRTYTDTEYQRMSTAQYAQGLAAAMKEAGFEPDRGDDFKKQMKAFREWQEAQKTDAQKQADALTTATKDLAAERSKTLELERKVLALGKGIPADKLPRYVKLAESYLGEDGDFDKAMDAALVDFPVAQPAAKDPTPSIVKPAQRPTAGEKPAYVPPPVI